ncbi:hypothetical protein D7X74_38865, partial [Corallococcus sp. CA047B]|uniref:hypothetical protein n=1 Tax=Corallococcus sp. CA047B TaxID=2316729 RepID=UPI000EA303D0
LDAELANVLASPPPTKGEASLGWFGMLRQVDDCPTPPAAACARSAGLFPYATLNFEGETTPRKMLETLCERCAPQDNPCASAVTRALQEAARRGRQDLELIRWSLEHSGAAMVTACQDLARLAVGPAALSGPDVEPPLLALLEELAPTCVKTEQLPAPLLNAAAVQQGARAPRLASLFTGRTVETGPIEPDQTGGPGDAFRAFDKDELSGVKLPVGTGSGGTEGVLRLGYAPSLKHMVSFQVRATGPGTLRAIIRTPQGVGRRDSEGGAFHVDPTVCRFRGTGRWEICKPAVPLLDVDAVSVLPERPGVELKELEIIGAR